VTTLPYTYYFNSPVSCYGYSYVSDISVDKYATMPAFITADFTDSTVTVLSFNPTTADIGVYTIRLTYDLYGDSSTY
jgi:hypothetical protein